MKRMIFDGFNFIAFILAGSCVYMFFETRDFDYVFLVFLINIQVGLKDIENKVERLTRELSK